jgi:UbiA prenyltransferase family/haloacid dehalogenase-like hydrolase
VKLVRDIASDRNMPSGTGRPPLFVDLDGTLVRTDTSLECIAALLCRHPLALGRALFAWRHGGGRARVKQELAAAAALDPAGLPYHLDLLAYLREQRAKGRALVLATGADRRMAAAVARHLALFDDVLASDGRTNLTGEAKLAAIRDTVGIAAPFAYIGNSRTDLAVWRAAAAAICVNARPAVERAAARATLVERSFPSAAAGWLGPLLGAIRPRQWAKNLLVFVPLLVAAAARAVGGGDLADWGDALLLFVAFCCAASGLCLIDDLWDLAADRRHPDKSRRRRPFASGALPLHIGLIGAPLLLAMSLVLSAAVGAWPLLLLLLYAAGACACSRRLKSRTPVAVFVLAGLYGIRLLAGGVATGYPLSGWLPG